MTEGGRRWAVAGAVAVVAMVAAALALTGVFSGDDGSGDEGAPSVESEFGSPGASVTVPVLPPADVRRYDVRTRVDSISAGAGYVWATGSLDGNVQRINPGSKRPIAVETAGFPTDVSAGEGAAWLALADGGAIQRVTGTEGAGQPIRAAGFPFQVAAGEGAVWAMSRTSVERIDPSTEEVGEPLELGGDLASIAAGEGGVWVVRGGEEIVKLNPSDGSELESAEIPGAFNVTAGESAVWALGARGGDGPATLSRIDPSGAVAGDSIAVPGAVDVATGLGYVWVIFKGGLLSRYDPATGVGLDLRPIEVGAEPLSVTVAKGAVWVAGGDGVVYRVTRL